MTDPADRPARTVPVLIGGDEMGRIDEAAQRLGLSPDALMESAGAAVAEIALVELASITEPVAGPGGPLAPGSLTVVLCGTGNNGGDGFVAARRLAAAGRPVVAVLVGDPSRIGGAGGSAAAHNWTVLQAMASAGSLSLFVAPTPELLLQLRPRLSPASLLIDALLGSGASGPLREPVSSAVDLANAIRTHATAAGRPCRVLAVDAPTRIDLTDGSRSDPVLAADLTVTFHRAKAGFALDPESRRLAGRYFVAPIGIPLEAEEGIVPADGEHPPARITQVTWQQATVG
ncbi:MAG TPA: NAD(P)H-hydrate epimerase [Candidatus Limnocylindria bacterium]